MPNVSEEFLKELAVAVENAISYNLSSDEERRWMDAASDAEQMSYGLGVLKPSQFRKEYNTDWTAYCNMNYVEQIDILATHFQRRSF